jgi:hypothetical protein
VVHSRNSSNEAKRKYRRHPKVRRVEDPDLSMYTANELKPRTKFLLEIREDVKGQDLSFAEIAKLVGENWRLLSSPQKRPYEVRAAFAKERHTFELAQFKKTENYRNYMRYLADFKVRNGMMPAGTRLLRHNQALTTSIWLIDDMDD